MVNYTAACDAHDLEVPENFNFGRDVIDRLAQDQNNIALVWCDKDGNERTFSYTDIATASNRVAHYLISQ